MTMPVPTLLLARAAAPAPGALAGWSPDPTVLVALIGLVLLYAHAVRQLWTSVGRPVGIPPRRVGLFAAGVLALAVALLSPLDELSGSLFSAHMVQHLLLTVVAAPLLVAGRAPLTLVPLLPLALRRRTARWLARELRTRAPLGMVLAVVLYVAVVVAWHLPVLYELAVVSAPVHALEHLSMLGAAMPFWAAMGAGRSAPVPAAGLGAFAVALSFTLLAATMTIAATPWYDSHLAATARFGLTPLEDQQLAAAVMWVPGGLVYLGAAFAAVVRWIQDDETAQRLRAGGT